MKIINFPGGQRSKEWKEWRKTGIGASEIAVILEDSPYKTPLSLWKEKSGFAEETKITAPMRHGILNEDKVLRIINKREGLDLQPICVEDVQVSIFKASFDGYDKKQKTLCEVKCPFSSDKFDEIKKNATLPKEWDWQLRWQMMLAKPVRAFCALMHPETEEIYTIELLRDENFEKLMQEKALEFWRKVQNGTPPSPKLGDYMDRSEEYETKEVFKTMYDAIAKRDELENIVSDCKKKLSGIGDGEAFLCGPYKACLASYPSSLDRKAMEEDGIKVSNYMKKREGFYYRFSKSKN